VVQTVHLEFSFNYFLLQNQYGGLKDFVDRAKKLISMITICTQRLV